VLLECALDLLAQVIVYPLATLLLVGLLFMHVSLRSKASLVSLLSLFFLIAWLSVAHWAFHLYLAATATPGSLEPYERIGTYSAHPTFDSVNAIVSCAVLAIFCLSFFLSSVSIPSSKGDKAEPLLFKAVAANSATITSLWIRALFALALSLISTICYYWLGTEGSSVKYAAVLFLVALASLSICVLFIAIATRRTIGQSRRT
jgi:hypothetical protein